MKLRLPRKLSILIRESAIQLVLTDQAMPQMTGAEFIYPLQQVLKREVEAWVADRHSKHAKANWQFTTRTRG